MWTATKCLSELTAGDVMIKDVVKLGQDMPLKDAARILLDKQVGGAPVVDGEGRCVGVLSATDFLRLGDKRPDASQPLAPPLPVTCPFQVKRRVQNGTDVTLCILPPGVCPIQSPKKAADGSDMLVCTQPHCVLSDWQIVELEELPPDAVRHFMTPDPVMVGPAVPIRILARSMIDAHIHRLIVTDVQKRPIGIVSSTDILAAVAYSHD
jgi:CBS domain-containing protein